MKNIRILFLGLCILTFSFSCSEKTSSKISSTEKNPPAAGFDLTNSDAAAIKIADQVMEAMGGRKAYDETRYLFWNFFGSRTLLWDKHKGDVRIESQKDDFTVVMNIHSMKGKVKMKGAELSHPDSLTKYLQRGKNIWINDSYWLVMPFKLKDSGVTLKHLGEEKTEAGKMADVLELNFKGVGKTPDNKYHVFVDQATKLVSQWTFYPKSTDTEPRFSTPWDGYKTFGKIKLSGGRGTYQLTEINVLEKVEDEIFEFF
ncbi:MAG: hypothetical protein AB8H03_09765 [Saprospiraceae bacterium]